MAHRLLPFTLLATLAAVSACGGGERAEQTGTGEAVLAGNGYTSDQLEQALLTGAPGYQRQGDPDSGEYGTLKAFQDLAQLRRQVTVDRPRCQVGGGGLVGNVEPDVPAALATFTRRDGQTVTETLMGMSDADAEKQVNARVPAGCLTFRTKVGSQWSEHRVAESPRGAIGEGSRTVGVTTLSGGAHTRSWYVVFKARHYVATISVFGANATRQEAERLARQSLAQARQILP
ncbi:hypothetical protein [Actinomadura rubrisoli]|uniref:Sensor domain-containing protein n=1 Tax=Actinomadura rubrisoli TaxID=2530368 RepID=A0A4R5BX30_9ACTN|nr:hypothetical protein [Actinomadura rubrisoli]TDD89940.1 hypothetical protein E1298_13545 [Actinomadura rubrisoli]